MRKIIGGFEKVDFPVFGIKNVRAKIDTGAVSGALHCSTPVIEVDATGAKILIFSPFDNPDVVVRTSDYATRRVKSSNGTHQSRYAVNTFIKIRNKSYPITITLSDRKTMMLPVLIGRKFLRDNGFLVDVRQETK